MRILHISDIHYRPADQMRIDRIIAGAVQDVVELRSSLGMIDLVIFSGDLTFSGTSEAEFEEAYENTIKKIADAASVGSERVLIAPGNHDISRTTALAGSGVIETGLKGVLRTRESLNDFVRTVTKVGYDEPSIARIKPYHEFAQKRLAPSCTHRDPFVEVHQIGLPDGTIAIALFNSAWRSTGAGESERKQLLVSEYAVQTSLPFIVAADIRCAVLHHPFEWLDEFDRGQVEASILKNFDLVMHGHVHESFPDSRINATGATLISQAGCLYQSQVYPNSYQLLELNLPARTALVHIRTWYDAPRGIFGQGTAFSDTGKLELPLKLRSILAQTPVDRVLLLGRALIRYRANEHVTMDVNITEDILRVFVCPPLERIDKPEAHSLIQPSEASKSSGVTEQKSKVLSLSEVLKGGTDLVFIGSRESGRSTLAHYIAVIASEGGIDRPRVPAIMDMRKTSHVNDLSRGIKAYFTHDTFDASEGQLLADLASSYDECEFVVMLDNFDPHRPHHLTAWKRMKALGPQYRWILLCEQGALSPGLSKLREIAPDALYIKLLPFSRRLLRELSKRRLPETETNFSIIETVMNQFDGSDLPRTGYIVSLLLWMSQQRIRIERLNSAELIRALVDHFLDRTDFTQAVRGTFDSTLKELLLQHLAARLNGSEGHEDSASLQAFLRDFFQKKGLEFDAMEALNVLCNSGILIRESNFVSFRYGSFLEYFNALYILNNEDASKSARIAENLLPLRGEIDLLTALKRETKGFDQAVVEAINQILQSEHFEGIAGAKLIDLDFDQSNVRFLANRSSVLAAIDITSEMIDDVHDAAEEVMHNPAAGLTHLAATLGESATGKSEATAGRGENDVSPEIVDVARTMFQRMASDREEDITPKPKESILNAISLVHLLATVIRNVEFEDLTTKIKLAKFCFAALSTCLVGLYRDMIAHKDTIRKKITSGEHELTDDEFQAIVDFSKLSIFSMFSCSVSDRMVTANLAKVLEAVAVSEEDDIGTKLQAALLLTDLHTSSAPNILRRVLVAARSNFYNLVAYERLTMRYLTKALSRSQRTQLIGLIADIEAALSRSGLLGQVSKGMRMAALERMAPSTEE